MPETVKYALLVDGDNVNLSYLKPLQEHIAAEGGCIDKIHLFGKLRSSYLDDWRTICPTQPGIVAYTITDRAKNSTDVKMLCTAMKLYYNGIKNFIIMSSDSDMEAFISGMYQEANIIVAYTESKIALDFLDTLHQLKVKTINLDELRGPLAEDQINTIINQIMTSYINFKLSKEFFSYKTVLSWITERYPELNALSVDDIKGKFQDIQISFDENGAHVVDKEV